MGALGAAMVAEMAERPERLAALLARRADLTARVPETVGVSQR